MVVHPILLLLYMYTEMISWYFVTDKGIKCFVGCFLMKDMIETYCIATIDNSNTFVAKISYSFNSSEQS